MKKLFVFALLATTAFLVDGCKDDVFAPEAYISNVEPDFVVQGRTKQVTIRGVVTTWSATGDSVNPAITPANIDFGAGVTVDAVTVVNQGTLIVDITADATAAFGTRDVDEDYSLYGSCGLATRHTPPGLASAAPPSDPALKPALDLP